MPPVEMLPAKIPPLTIPNFRALCPKLNVARGVYTSGHIGLLMGSFNPAHEGHLYASARAQSKLHFRVLWWLITPQNPLKEKSLYQPIEKRYQRAAKLLENGTSKIALGMPEILMQKNYIAQSLLMLGRAFPHARFSLIIGSDNLYQLPRWHDFKKIQQRVNLVVIRREPFHYPAMIRFRGKIKSLNQNYACSIVNGRIFYIDGSSNPASSRTLRAGN